MSEECREPAILAKSLGRICISESFCIALHCILDGRACYFLVLWRYFFVVGMIGMKDSSNPMKSSILRDLITSPVHEVSSSNFFGVFNYSMQLMPRYDFATVVAAAEWCFVSYNSVHLRL